MENTLSTYCKKQGIKAAQLAKLSDVPLQTLYNWYPDKLRRIDLMILGIKVEQISQLKVR